MGNPSNFAFSRKRLPKLAIQQLFLLCTRCWMCWNRTKKKKKKKKRKKEKIRERSWWGNGGRGREWERRGMKRGKKKKFRLTCRAHLVQAVTIRNTWCPTRNGYKWICTMEIKQYHLQIIDTCVNRFSQSSPASTIYISKLFNATLYVLSRIISMWFFSFFK